jgi:fructose-specific phosphotransferase system IIC component
VSGKEVLYVTIAVLMVRTDPTAEDSFAAMRERMRFGIAMAAMIKMIATTISNSISEKPFCFFMRSP